MTLTQEERDARTTRLQALMALRTADPDQLSNLLAAKYVRRGSRWLWEHASPGWWRNCLNGGSSRIRIGRGNEGPLTFAFEYCSDMTDQFGYVQDYMVLKHFDLQNKSRLTGPLGLTTDFFGGSVPFKRYPAVKITVDVLDKAWAELVENPPSEWRINYRHRTPIDQLFQKPPKRTLGRRLREILHGDRVEYKWTG